MKKRMVSLFTALCLCLSFFPPTAWAAEADDTPVVLEQNDPAGNPAELEQNEPADPTALEQNDPANDPAPIAEGDCTHGNVNSNTGVCQVCETQMLVCVSSKYWFTDWDSALQKGRSLSRAEYTLYQDIPGEVSFEHTGETVGACLYMNGHTIQTLNVSGFVQVQIHQGNIGTLNMTGSSMVYEIWSGSQGTVNVIKGQVTFRDGSQKTVNVTGGEVTFEGGSQGTVNVIKGQVTFEGGSFEQITLPAGTTLRSVLKEGCIYWDSTSGDGISLTDQKMDGTTIDNVQVGPCTHKCESGSSNCAYCGVGLGAKMMQDGNETYYPSFDAARKAGTSHERVITLLKDDTIPSYFASENFGFTLNLNGKTMTGNVSFENYSKELPVTLTGTGTFAGAISVTKNSTLAVKGDIEVNSVHTDASEKVKLTNGQFGKVSCNGEDYVIDMVPDGSAFFDTDTGDIVRGDVSSLENVSVKAHTCTAELEKTCTCGRTKYAPHNHCLHGKEDDCNEQEWQPWTKNNALPTIAGRWYLTQDVTVSSSGWDVSTRGIDLCLNGHNITASKNEVTGNEANWVIKIERNIPMTLTDCQTTPGKLTGATNGVLLEGSTFTMYGGEISGNEWGVYYGKQGSEFKLYGGKITGNATGVDTSGEFTMYGGEISGNSNCGVNIEGNITKTISGGTITGNGTRDVVVNGGDLTLGGNAAITGKGIYDVIVNGGDLTLGGNAAITGKGIYFLQADGKLRVSSDFAGQAVLACGSYTNDRELVVLNDGATTNGITLEQSAADLGYTLTADGKLKSDHVHPECGSACTDGEKHSEEGWTRWNATDSLPTGTGNYYLVNDIYLKETSENYAQNSRICLNGHTIYGPDGDYAIKTQSTQTLTNCQTTPGQITHQAGKTGGGVWMDGGKGGNRLNLYHVTITGNNGGGVVVEDEYSEDVDGVVDSVQVKLGGTAKVIGNTREDKPYNICFGRAGYLNVSDDFTGEAGITLNHFPENRLVFKASEGKDCLERLHLDVPSSTNGLIIGENGCLVVCPHKKINGEKHCVQCDLPIVTAPDPEPEPEPTPEPDIPSYIPMPPPNTGNKTVTVTNPDGSTTTTETKKDGTVIETTKKKDGSTTTVETRKDGTVTETNKTATGTTATTVTDKNGNVTESRVSVSAKDAKSDETVTLPVQDVKISDRENATEITVEVPKNTSVKVEVPVEDVTPGTVVVIVHEDGTEEIVKKSASTENGVQFEVSGNVTIKVVDNSKSFEDVDDGYWGKDAVDFVSSRELFNGVSESEYAPEENMTRAMLFTVMARLDGQDTTYSDDGAWYQKSMDWAKEVGISDGTDPNGSITREQLVTMLYRYAGEPEVSGESNTDKFSDHGDVSDWAAKAMQWAVEKGILNGMDDGTLNPQGEATRAQVAVMLMRFVNAN